MRALLRLISHTALAAGSMIVVFQAVLFVKIGLMVVLDPPTTSFMRAQQIALQNRPVERKSGPAAIQHVWVSYENISRNVKRAIIAAEDSNFAEHAGVDIEALEKAYYKNRRRGRVVAGGSTITQQLAKNLFLTGDRSYVRKAQEFLITFMLESWLDKERIFEVYMNVVEWGVGVFGVEAAARHYYGTSAARLGAAQAAKLAAMLPNPRFYDRNRYAPYLLARTNTILARMGAAQLP